MTLHTHVTRNIYPRGTCPACDQYWATEDNKQEWFDKTAKPDFVPPPLRNQLIWAAVDFDGTIAESTWSPQNPQAAPGPVLPGVREKIDELVAHGYKIIIHTSRSWTDYETIEAYMVYHGLTFHRIVCGKLLAKVYIDDRNVMPDMVSWVPGQHIPA